MGTNLGSLRIDQAWEVLYHFSAELLLYKIKSIVYFDVMRPLAECFKRSFVEDEKM